MTDIVLFEYKRTRSEKCRWVLAEAELQYRSEGNSPRIIGSEELCRVHPLGKLPAALIDGKPLFESSAIVNTIADLVPEKNLIPKHGTWERALHDQWAFFAMSEVEAWAWSGFLNNSPFLMPEEKRRREVIVQSGDFYRKGLAVLENHFANSAFILGDRFFVTDILVSFAILMGRAPGYLDDGFPNTKAYLSRLAERPVCPFKPT